MNSKRLRIVFIALCSTLFVTNSQADIAIIAHPSVSTEISKSDLSRVYLGKTKKLPGGYKVEAISLPNGSPVRDEFNSNVLEKSDSQFKTHWSRLLFSGQAKPPKVLETEQDVINAVASDQKKIGYINKDNVTDNVKVLAVF